MQEAVHRSVSRGCSRRLTTGRKLPAHGGQGLWNVKQPAVVIGGHRSPVDGEKKLACSPEVRRFSSTTAASTSLDNVNIGEHQERSSTNTNDHGETTATATASTVDVGVPTWRSTLIFHDQGVFSAYNSVVQYLGTRPEEENRKLADEFYYQIKCMDQTFEGRSRNKRAARKEAAKKLMSGLAHTMTQEKLDEICLVTGQKLILDSSKTGANSLNVRTVPSTDGTETITVEVSIGGLEATGSGETDLIARVTAFDSLVMQLQQGKQIEMANDSGLPGSMGKKSSALRAAAMMSRHNTVAQRLRNNTEFHDEFVDGKWTVTVVWSDGDFAQGVHSSKTLAKSLAAENMLVKKGVLQRSLTEEELALADDPEGPETLNKLPPSAWELFLPQMWKTSPTECLPYLTQRTPEEGYMPVDLWETLIEDTAARGVNEVEEGLLRQKNQDIRDLCNCCVEGEFYAKGGAEYFHKWRGLIGLEDHAMFSQATDEVESIGPLTVSNIGNWPQIKLEGVGVEALRSDDLILVRGRPCRVMSTNAKNQHAMLKLLDPREDDADLLAEGSEVFGAPFGMAVPNERMVRAVKSFSGYKPPEYDSVQPVPVCEWLQNVLVNPEGIGFGSENDHTEKVAEPVQPLATIPLSDSQREALEAATSRRITLIQGPPGTGKTYCGAAIVGSFISSHPHVRVLACADSNVAADNLCFKIQQLVPGARVVRVGDGGCDELRNQVLTKEGKSWEDLNSTELRDARSNAMRRQLPHAQVVVATCVGSGMETLDVGGGYDLVVIDEASQALEPATLVALERAGPDAKHVVLIGDHRQLPPTVLSNDYQVGVSLFQRLADRGVDPLLLIEQRRMHSKIADFPNRNFYNGRLVDATNDEDLPSVAATDSNVEMVHCAPAEFQGNEVKHGESTCNHYEAEKLVQYLVGLYNSKPEEIDSASIGVLAPYAAQKRVLENLLFEAGLCRDNIRVDTVDGFQGMEKDIILFSATRSNARGDLGFLKDPRRMNVMLTRARKSLVVFADATTLRSSTAGHWSNWVQWVQEHGKVTGDELASAFSSTWHQPPVNAAGEAEESDFLKMLRANDAGATSFTSATVNLQMEHNEVKPGRPASPPADPQAEEQELSEEDFNRLMGDHTPADNEQLGKTQAAEADDFLRLLDDAAKRQNTITNDA